MDRSKIKQKLIEVINNSDFNNTLREQGLSEDQKILIEVKFLPTKPITAGVSPDLIEQLVSQVTKNGEDVLAIIERHCPCDPQVDPPSKCCYR